MEAGDAVGPGVEARVLAAPAPLVVPSVVGVVLDVGVTVRVKLVFNVVKVVVSRKVVKLPSTKEMSWRSSSLSPPSPCLSILFRGPRRRWRRRMHGGDILPLEYNANVSDYFTVDS